MAENSAIQWTDHTFNPWRGCTKVAAGCTNCYAESMSKRNPKVLGIWGKHGTRVVAAEAYWRKPLKWAKDAREALSDWEAPPFYDTDVKGQRPPRPRVFCASLADVFEDRPDLVEPRVRLFNLINDTPELDWLLLTKRPENIARLAPGLVVFDEHPPNIWLGTSVACQEDAGKNIPELLKIPAAVRFVSYEPAIGPVNFAQLMEYHKHPHGRPDGDWATVNDCLTGFRGTKGGGWTDEKFRIDWLIVGGESGPNARPCDVAWIRSAVEQCKAASVACFVKQMGREQVQVRNADGGYNRRYWKHKKGGDPSEWPEDLRVREFPPKARQA